jgi:hypothetical protein
MRGHRLRTLALPVFLASALLLPFPARAASPTLRVTFSITGGYRYTGALTTSAALTSARQTTNYTCAIQRVVDAPVTYLITFNVHVLQLGQLTGDAFDLLVRNFTPGTTAITRARDVEIDLAVRGRFVYHIIGEHDPRFHITVHLAADGRSGSFAASHLLVKVPTTKSRDLLFGKYRQGAPVDVHGSWQCATLATVL